MLRQRVVTALILAAGFIAVLLFAPFTVQAAVFGCIAAAGAWEWAALAGWRSAWARALYAAIFLGLCAGLWVFCDLLGAEPVARVRPWLAGAALLWSAMLVGLRSYPGGRWIWSRAVVRLLMGWAMLSATWLAVVFTLRLVNGPFVLFTMILTIAVADIGAYFVGRQFGRHRLAESISPAKTWEGFWGGLLAVTALAVLIWANLPLTLLHLGLGSLIALAIATGGASVVGDLTVSLVKREVGVKDSGTLLPGHGGLMDRLDSICGAAPVFAFGLILVGY